VCVSSFVSDVLRSVNDLKYQLNINNIVVAILNI
jgi:hypothetical protein